MSFQDAAGVVPASLTEQSSPANDNDLDEVLQQFMRALALQAALEDHHRALSALAEMRSANGAET